MYALAYRKLPACLAQRLALSESEMARVSTTVRQVLHLANINLQAGAITYALSFSRREACNNIGGRRRQQCMHQAPNINGMGRREREGG